MGLILDRSGALLGFSALMQCVRHGGALQKVPSRLSSYIQAHHSVFWPCRWCVTQVTASEYLAGGRLPAALQRVQKVYAERARVMMRHLNEALGDALQYTAPQGGMFIWASLTGSGGSSRDAAAFVKRGVEKGVAAVPGAPFFATNVDHSTFRMSYASVPEDKIIEGVKRLAQAL